MKILSMIYGNPCSFCLLEKGTEPITGVFNNSNPLVEFKKDNNLSDIRYFATTFPQSNLINKNKSDYREIQATAAINDGQIYCLGNNQAIAANTYFSSEFNDAIIITLMDEGEEQNGFKSSVSVWHGYENSIGPVHTFGTDQLNIIRIWSNISQTVFSLQPSVESFSKVVEFSRLGNPDKYYEKMWNMITDNHEIMSLNLTRENIKLYFDLFSENKIPSEDKNDIAAAIQKCTKDLVLKLLKSLDEIRKIENLCFSGLTIFNDDLLEYIKKEFPDTGIYVSNKCDIDEVAIGAARFISHVVLNEKRKSLTSLPSASKLGRMKKADLVSLSTSIGLDLSSSKTKKEIISAIENIRV